MENLSFFFIMKLGKEAVEGSMRLMEDLAIHSRPWLWEGYLLYDRPNRMQIFYTRSEFPVFESGKF